MAGARQPRLVASTSAVIGKPLDVVAAHVLDIEPGPVDATNAPLLALTGRDMILAGGPDRFEGRVAGDAHDGTRLTVEVDRERRLLAVEGQWWYRGEYALDADPAGTRLTYRILNLTAVPNPVIELWQRALLRRQRADTDAMATAIARALP